MPPEDGRKYLQRTNRRCMGKKTPQKMEKGRPGGEVTNWRGSAAHRQGKLEHLFINVISTLAFIQLGAVRGQIGKCDRVNMPIRVSSHRTWSEEGPFLSTLCLLASRRHLHLPNADYPLVARTTTVEQHRS